MSELENRLFLLVANAFGCSFEEINIDSVPSSVERWDSMSHVFLICEIEREFGISFTPNDLTKLGSIKNIIETLKQKQGF